jgi:acyl transferase domain-containing protein/acyl-CoA thioesterase FadM
MPAASYYDADPNAEDRTYGQLGAFIDGFIFDLAARRVPRSSFVSTDITHWLALEVAASALEDGGYASGAGLPVERTGVIVGNSLTGEDMRANLLRLRWPFLERLLRQTAQAEGFPASQIDPLIDAAGARFRSHFPAANEDSLAGALSNTIAGRICGNFDFGGGGYVVDGACSSSLLAVATAAAALEEGRVDAALAGGVDISLDPFELVGFAKARALTKSAMRVYDRRGNGFIPGEGCGFVLLKRLADAEAAGDKVYAVIRGWGISSDGRNAITAPKVSGQARAIRTAWERSGRPDFVEGHGTGTAVGDKVELEAIASVVGPTEGRPIGVTSLKSILGHTKAAAGIGAFMKTVMAVNRRIIPPTAGCQDPNPVFFDGASTLYPLMRGEIRPVGDVLSGGVSAMGFGGINSHVVVSSGPLPDPRIAPPMAESAIMASYQESELFVFGAQSLSALRTRLRALRPLALEIAVAEMADLSAQLLTELPARPAARAAIVADTPETLVRRIDMLLAADQADGPEVWLEARQDLSRRNARLAFVCPGQGSQDLKMGRWLLDRDPALATLAQQMMASAASATGIDLQNALYPDLNVLDDAGRNAARLRLANTALAQPALCLVSYLWAQKLAAFGLVPHVLGGHSLGELCALAMAGAFDADTLMRLAARRGQLMTPQPGAQSTGGMTSLQTDVANASRLCGALGHSPTQAAQADKPPLYAAIANVNGPQQVVVAGTLAALDVLEVNAANEGIKFKRLPVSNGFHSALVDEAAQALRQDTSLPAKPLRLDVPVVSSLATPDLQTDLAAHVADHARSQVDFVRILTQLACEADLIIEVGAGRVLSGLAEGILGNQGPRCLPVEGSAGRIGDLHAVLASAWVRGATPSWSALHAGRFIRPFVAAQNRSFIVSRCEAQQAGQAELLPLATPAAPAHKVAELPPAAAPAPAIAHAPASAQAVLALIIAGVVTRTGFNPASVTGNMHLRDDLNLDSIKAGEIIGSTARAVGVADRVDPARLSNHSLLDIAAALSAAGATIGQQAASAPATAPSMPTQAVARASVAELAPDASQMLINLIAERTGFAPESISGQQRLRDDLNLDSIKVGELIATAARQLGVADKVDPSSLSGHTIAGIAAALMAARPAGTVQPASSPAAAPQTAGVAPAHPADGQAGVPWVRSFGLRAVAVPPIDVPGIRHGRVVHVVARNPAPLVAALHAADAQTDAQNADAMLVQMSGDLAERVELLAEAVKGLTPNVQSVLFLQHTDGRFGLDQVGNGQSVHAFARSLSQERPRLAVAVLDLAPDTGLDAIAREIPQTPGFSCAGLDAQGRWQLDAVPLQPLQQPRPQALQAGELVLVTGGARGITAACAARLARHVKVKLALVGSTPREKVDDEVLRTLGQLALDGIEARYWCCDLADANAVLQLVKEIHASQGPIAAVVHGAGRNTPRRVEQLRADEALAEMAPKVLGAKHLLAALESAPPRIFCAFTSIIGVSGMVGNAWYAFANETLDMELGRFCAAHRATSAVSIAYGVWDEIGMGAKLGSVATLARMGFGALSPADGTQRFLDLMLFDPGVRQVVVTANVDGVSTWPTRRNEDDKLRFLNSAALGVPGVDCRVTLSLHPERDAFLRDHVFAGSYLMPTVFGLEAMAQSAWAARGGQGDICRISDIRLPAPVVVAAEGTRIEVRALVRETDPDIVDCEVRTELTGFARAHFQATLHFGTPRQVTSISFPELPRLAAPLMPAQDLYGGLLFQGERFQKMGPIEYATDGHLLYTGVVGEPDSDERWLLGDPYFRDTLLQAGQVLVPLDDALPVALESITLGAGNAISGARSVHSSMVSSSGRSHFGVVRVLDDEGNCVEQIDGYEVRVLAHHPNRPSLHQILVPGDADQARLRQRVAEICEKRGLNLPQLVFSWQALHQYQRDQRRESLRPLLAQLDETLVLDWDQDGRPLTGKGYGVSIAHDDHGCLLVLGEQCAHGIGCDLEPIRPRDPAILGGGLGVWVRNLRAGGDNMETAITRAWAIGEAIYKAGGGYDGLEMAWREQDMVELRTPELRIISFVAELARGPRRIVAIALPVSAPPVTVEAHSTSPGTMLGLPHLIDPNCHLVSLRRGSPDMMVTRFVIAFDESATLAGKVPAYMLASWMGRLREMALTGIKQELREALASGRYGMVTEQAGVTLLGEAAALDVIEAHTWVEALTANSGVLRFAFHRVGENGLEHIGDAFQRFAWVEVMGPGQIRPGNFPPFLRQFLTALHQTATPAPVAPLLQPTTPALARTVNRTTLVESNVVGNLYFVHSFKWPTRLLDRSLWQALPDIFRSRGQQGELLITGQRVEYVREAMPFDDIEVSVHLESVNGAELTLAVVYQRPENFGTPTRLALGQISARWVQRDARGVAHVAALPSQWPGAQHHA